MATAPISLSNLASRIATAPARSAPGAGSVGDGSFAELVARFVQDVNGQQQAADQAVRQFATGQTDNVHDVVLAMAKADLEFRFLLEIRNRLIDAYQELMRMQI